MNGRLGSWQAAVTLIGSDCASGMFRLKTKLVIKMMRYRRIGLVVKI